jgi:hypothetical protein
MHLGCELKGFRLPNREGTSVYLDKDANRDTVVN